MAIPDLARNAPVAEVFNPVKINFFKPFGNYFHRARQNGFAHHLFQRLAVFGFFVHVHEPLQFYLRFNDAFSSAVYGHAVRVLTVHFFYKPF